MVAKLILLLEVFAMDTKTMNDLVGKIMEDLVSKFDKISSCEDRLDVMHKVCDCLDNQICSLENKLGIFWW
jgi:hypothetical protein